MKVTETELPGILLVEPAVFGDARGFFMETWSKARYAEAGIPVDFVQDNISFSPRGVLRGLHFQKPNTQGKLVYVLHGAVFDVAVDTRAGSPDFGRWVGVSLSADNKRQLYIPPGFAHGFCVTSDAALFAYKCTDVYNPGGEATVRWDDPAIGIRWPVAEPLVSDKDRAGVLLQDFAAQSLPQYLEDTNG